MGADFAEIGGEDRRPLHAERVAAPEWGAWRDCAGASLLD
jgi:hypothetical protein